MPEREAGAIRALSNIALLNYYQVTMRILRAITAFLLLATLTGVHAEVQLASAAELQPAAKHERATDIITHITTAYHYKQTKLDDEMSPGDLR
ncbi:MAG: hypothetical protein U5P41_16240 [Gammaproteobacteria bacterium]|nr:hypothetical protein [Gammaproteobacteria bacterium]